MSNSNPCMTCGVCCAFFLVSFYRAETALTGRSGENAYCTIYKNRSSTCSEFAMSGENGEVKEACNRARAKSGFPQFKPFFSLKQSYMTSHQKWYALTKNVRCPQFPAGLLVLLINLNQVQHDTTNNAIKDIGFTTNRYNRSLLFPCICHTQSIVSH